MLRLHLADGAAAAPAGAAAAAPAAAAPDQPCTVHLRLWCMPENLSEAVIGPEHKKLSIGHAVLCSEMGAHFSPCGRYLAVCVACYSVDPERLPPAPDDVQYLMYELRVYSLMKESFGKVLAARPVRAAHCLTSIQFSPTSQHILLAYGKRHAELRRSPQNHQEDLPVYTILEIFRVADMARVRVVPSAEDEVNVACFHSWAGGGLAYGTKEGRLRIFRHRAASAPPPPPREQLQPAAAARVAAQGGFVEATDGALREGRSSEGSYSPPPDPMVTQAPAPAEQRW